MGYDNLVKIAQTKNKGTTMNYEEKYKEALERAKKLYGKYCINNVLESLFPELNKDERIRKKLITYFQDLKGGWFEDISHEDIIAWLEKQGEQKPKWKQRDDIRFSQLYDFLVNKTPRLQVDCNEYATWLNSLKQRML